jgi:hypothetical protein
MKVLRQIVTVFIAINLINASATLAQDRTEELRKLHEDLARADAELAKLKDAGLARQAADLAKSAVEMATHEAKMQADLAVQQARLALGQVQYGTDRVLAVLTDPTKAQDVAATTEDLNIMSRIFDKKLGPIYGSAFAGVNASQVGVSSINGLLSVLRQRDGSQGTRAIYLQGYAALFLISVDFPLSAPPKVEAEKIEKDVDPVWQNTKQEISASDKTPEGEYLYVKSEPAKEYDAEKVEDLKTELTKALRHAANIRNLKPDELIILAVASPPPAIGAPTGVAEITVKGGPKSYQVITDAPTSLPFGAALLTMRAKKSDIDAYAKGELDLKDFRARVQVFTGGLGPAPAEGIEMRSRY